MKILYSPSAGETIIDINANKERKEIHNTQEIRNKQKNVSKLTITSDYL